MEGKISYWNGDKVRFTGKVVESLGATWHEFVFVEGHRKGQYGVTRADSFVARVAK